MDGPYGEESLRPKWAQYKVLVIFAGGIGASCCCLSINAKAVAVCMKNATSIFCISCQALLNLLRHSLLRICIMTWWP